MRVGDLPQARKPGSHRGGPVVRALCVALALGLLLAGWQIWPSSSASGNFDETTMAAAVPQEPVAVEVPQPAAPAPAPAEAEPVAPDGAALLFGPPLSAGADGTIPSEPDFTGSNAPHLAPENPEDGAQAAASEPTEEPQAPVPTAVAGIGEVAPVQEAQPSDNLIDLNTASLEELNSLEGAGRIGRAIIRGRPYASVEELATKKVIRRSVLERIKDQVTVR